ncbi:ribonuclease H-like domain-containing protein [Tanacetum coccineum]|uniref:Ribonuclease H-like domain-containing protein n=1 Tax=Tanacetum coccineum TaxID=301880 RepID=A0ABQ5EZ94_9ASTR
MDTGATSHLASDAGKLTSISNNSIISSIFVGNGNSIPVTTSGHSMLPTLNRPLHLHNVLVTPQIIKNLISVRQFTRDNNCSIEFDPFGFSVKDLWTRHLLLRCNSNGDLYPVLPPNLSNTAFVSINQSTWHQRLGHPGHEVLRFLASNKMIDCTQTKTSSLCHACQLGKQVRLPFSISNSRVENLFDIVHSDLWTSPIPSASGFKYYVLFLDHFSHFLWVYPLRKKSDVFDKFLHFRMYVKTQFNTEIKSFQCDHGEDSTSPISLRLLTTPSVTSPPDNNNIAPTGTNLPGPTTPMATSSPTHTTPPSAQPTTPTSQTTSAPPIEVQLEPNPTPTDHNQQPQ